jgi:Domain of Unknown Function (DUF748)
MKLQLAEFRAIPGFALAYLRSPRARKYCKYSCWVLGIIVAIGVLGALAAPPLVRWKLEQELTKALHRTVTIESLRVNPYALTVAISGLRVNERDGDTSVLSATEIFADVSSASLFRLAPVLSALRVAGLKARVVRLEANRYNWSDLIDEILNRPADPNEPPPRFAVANIELMDGGIDFDDRPEGLKHEVSAIHLAIPFLSSLPVDQDITVEPKFSAKVDGTPVELAGKAKPFKDTRDTSLNVDVHGLDITRFLKYLPGALPVKIASARLESDLDLTFAQPKGKPASVVLSGMVAVRDLDIQEPSGAPLLKLARLALNLTAVEPLMRRFEISKIALDTPELRVHRRSNGETFLTRILAPKTDAGRIKKPDATSSSAPNFMIGEIAVTGGRMDALDEHGSKPVRMKFDEIRMSVHDISSAPDASSRFDFFAHATTNDAITLAGTFGMQPLQATGTLKVERVQLPALWPYVEPYLAADASEGQIDIAAAFTYSAADGTPNVILKELELALRSLALRQRSDKQELLRIPELAIHGGTLDLRAQTATAGELATRGGRINVRRDRDGVLNLQKLSGMSSTKAPADTAAPVDAKPWTATLKKLSVDRYAATVEDEGAGAAATANIENLALTATNLTTTKGQNGQVALKLTLNKTGTLAISGPYTNTPLSARLKIDARELGIVPAQPYFERFINAIVSSGNVTAQGDLALDVPEGSAARATFKGDVTVGNFAAVTKAGNEDLLRWKSFQLGGVDLTSVPLKVSIADVALADFYTRLVVTADGQFNLQGLMAGKETPAAQASNKPDSAAPAAVATKSAPANTTTATIPAEPAPDIQIGKVTLTGGNVHFSDFFIKPNYSANLTGMTGSVSTITRETAGDINLRARIDSTAPVDVSGKINPLAKELFLDIKADARDIELSTLSAYAVKYVGYGIEKGKLSMKVAYKLDNRKLSAENKVILNQLTFGAKVDSPTATKLPVLFAVSLLKDRNGVIDIELPISGSIDDPQFSVGGIVVRVLLNLMVKAITSPFALIGALFGGGGEELSYVEFTPGSGALTPAASAKLANLSKALTDRPALQIEIAARVDPQADREGLRKTSIERKVKAQKLKDTVKGGTAAGSVDEITVEPGEYAKYLAKAYGEERFQKPRTMIGLAKDLPVPEMEQLMLINTQVTEEDLRQLAGQRAQKVKDTLVEAGKIDAGRVFLLTPRLSAEGIKDKGAPTRVDFSLKQ